MAYPKINVDDLDIVEFHNKINDAYKFRNFQQGEVFEFVTFKTSREQRKHKLQSAIDRLKHRRN